MTVDTDRFRSMLLEERERVVEALEHLQSEGAGTIAAESGELSHVDQHMGDQATITFERELDETLGDNSEHVLQQIDRALARIDDGTYGSCARCGNPIPLERLEAKPYAEYDVDCQRIAER